MRLCLCRCLNEELSDAIQPNAASPFTQGKSVGRDEQAQHCDLDFHLLFSKYVSSHQLQSKCIQSCLKCISMTGFHIHQRCRSANTEHTPFIFYPAHISQYDLLDWGNLFSSIVWGKVDYGSQFLFQSLNSNLAICQSLNLFLSLRHKGIPVIIFISLTFFNKVA